MEILGYPKNVGRIVSVTIHPTGNLGISIGALRSYDAKIQIKFDINVRCRGLSMKNIRFNERRKFKTKRSATP